ncbi:MAG: 2-amino-4-hydroxy-6-hydroxymethyldihydropteridine diphosphokinase [Legionellales bacterium]|nr:2-amino-4-hydroxy-6-hydroxymethyldihydropteridine diphosphokinase [Legionellales bacterium]|tara:strand:- start:26594 stop:27076 length:483 start_codon:yes stop_codon:yes gene_type:complete
MKYTTYIGLGSNLDNPIKQVNDALDALADLPDTTLVNHASLYQSAAMGNMDQPHYINSVAELATHLQPEDLLTELQGIENQQGRVREERWGPRTLDLDLLLYGDVVLESEQLTLPHYGLKQRAFVVVPLAEIAPDLLLPDGTALAELTGLFASDDLRRLC